MLLPTHHELRVFLGQQGVNYPESRAADVTTIASLLDYTLAGGNFRVADPNWPMGKVYIPGQPYISRYDYLIDLIAAHFGVDRTTASLALDRTLSAYTDVLAKAQRYNLGFYDYVYAVMTRSLLDDRIQVPWVRGGGETGALDVLQALTEINPEYGNEDDVQRLFLSDGDRIAVEAVPAYKVWNTARLKRVQDRSFRDAVADAGQLRAEDPVAALREYWRLLDLTVADESLRIYRDTMALAIFLLYRNNNGVDRFVMHRAVPRGRAPEYERALKVVHGRSKPPREPFDLILRNKRQFALLRDMLDWPERGGAERHDIAASLQETLDEPPFIIHNTIQARGPVLAEMLDVVRSAVARVRAFPKLASVLYGDVYFVGDIAKEAHRAWYTIQTDIVSLRPEHSAKQAQKYQHSGTLQRHWQIEIPAPPENNGATHSLIHELGHRYWFKMLTKAQQAEWTLYYRQIGRTRIAAEAVGVGDNVGGYYFVRYGVHITQGPRGARRADHGAFVTLEPDTDKQVFIKFSRWQDLLSSLGYPTWYASTAATEAFPEFFALYITGRLPDQFRAPFERIVGL